MECLFKAPVKDHCCARLFFSPSVQIAKTIAPRAAKVLADLGVAIDHGGSPDSSRHGLLSTRPLPTLRPGRKPRDSERTGHVRSRRKCKRFHGDGGEPFDRLGLA